MSRARLLTPLRRLWPAPFCQQSADRPRLPPLSNSQRRPACAAVRARAPVPPGLHRPVAARGLVVLPALPQGSVGPFFIPLRRPITDHPFTTCAPPDFSRPDGDASASTSSLPLQDAGQATPGTAASAASDVGGAPSTAPQTSAPTATPSRSRIQGFLRRVRSTQARPAQPSQQQARAARRPSHSDSTRRQHSIALNSAGLY